MPDNLVGQMVKCPGCKEAFKAVVEEAPPPEEPKPSRRPPEDDDRFRDEPPAERRPARRDADEDLDDDDDRGERRSRRRSRRNMAPHRGTLILILGILAWVGGTFVCGILAWIFGNNDLKEIRAGRMDPEGESMTNMVDSRHGRTFSRPSYSSDIVLFMILGMMGVVGVGVSGSELGVGELSSSPSVADASAHERDRTDTPECPPKRFARRAGGGRPGRPTGRPDVSSSAAHPAGRQTSRDNPECPARPAQRPFPNRRADPRRSPRWHIRRRRWFVKTMTRPARVDGGAPRAAFSTGASAGKSRVTLPAIGLIVRRGEHPRGGGSVGLLCSWRPKMPPALPGPMGLVSWDFRAS